MRRIIQAISLFLFSSLFYLATFRLPDWLMADIYLRLDPLLGVNAIFSKREIIPRVLFGLITIGVTILIGRFFCAYLCPTGASIDFLDYLLFRKKNRKPIKKDLSLKKLKYIILIIFLSSALIGLSLVFFMDPISLLTRFYTLFLYPLFIAFLNLLLDIFRPIFYRLGWISLSLKNFIQPVFYMSFITLIMFLTLIVLNRFSPRFWCRYLCPLGAFLSLFSPLGLFKRKVNDDCTKCLKCQRACPMGAIPDDPKKTNLSECIQCKTCSSICPENAIRFPVTFSLQREHNSFNISRRDFFSSIAGGLTFGFLTLYTPFKLRQNKFQIIRPPGALPEDEFLRTCIRCGECMKSCLTNTLQPCLWESGLAGIWTPRMDPRLAPCDQNCNVCGRVCPTQAIRSLPLEERIHAKVGTAILRKELCLVWSQNKLCLICDEICPYNAIVFRPIEGYRRPFVIASKCNGCGYCEQRCPVRGESAIVVVPDGEIRLKEGSYIKEAKKLELEFKPDPGDDKFIIEESGFKIEEEKTKEKIKPDKPTGFL